nr:hypothetical protein Iba_chr09bCG9590 [Ipomoea batatas]
MVGKRARSDRSWSGQAWPGPKRDISTTGTGLWWEKNPALIGRDGIILALMEARTKGSVVEFPGNEQICDSALREHKLVRLFAKRGRGVGKNAGTEIVMETLFMVPLIVVLKTPRTLFINKGRHTNATVEFTNGGGPVELPQSRAPVRFSVIDRSRPNPWAVDAGVTAMIATHTNTKRLAEE